MKTNDDRQVRAILTRKAQGQLLALKQWLFQRSATPHLALTIEGRSLQIRTDALATTEGDMIVFYQLSGQVLDAVRQAL